MKHAHQGTVTGEGYGYVYVMSYPGSDKVKIGHTLNPTKRAKDIGGTMGPEEPVLEAYFWCSERREAVERAAHKLEAASRHNGEWFTIPVTRAVEVIKRAAQQVNVSAQLVFDRNEWEAQAAAELAAQAEDLRVFEEKARVLKTARIETMKAEAEQMSLDQISKLIRGRHAPVRRHIDTDRYDVLQAEWLKKEALHRETLVRAATEEREYFRTWRGLLKTLTPVIQVVVFLLALLGGTVVYWKLETLVHPFVGLFCIVLFPVLATSLSMNLLNRITTHPKATVEELPKWLVGDQLT